VGKRRRNPWIPIAIGAAVVLVAAGVVFALSSGGGGKSGRSFKESTVVDLKPGGTTLEYACEGCHLDFPTDARDSILKVIGTYIDDGIVKSLRTGKANDAKLGQVFDQGAAGQLKGLDRAALFDEGLPKAVGKIEVKASPVPLSGLVSTDQKVILVSARIFFRISAQTESGTVKMTRFGELLFAPNLSGGWKVTSFTIRVDRSGPGVEPAPTTTAAPAPSEQSTTTTTAAP